MSNPAQMINSQFYTAISQPRFLKYYTVCGNSRRTALKLYRANIVLSQKMYAIIGVVEIILRNSIDRHFALLKGNSWLEDAVQPGGYLDISIGCEDSYHSIQENIQKLGIAHYEPICFDKSTGIVSTAFVLNRYNLVLELLHWLGCNPRRILYGIDSVNSGVNAINHLSFNRHLIN